LKIGGTFPRFQEYYTLTVQFNDKQAKGPVTTGRYYVGKYFTSKGEFDEVLYVHQFSCPPLISIIYVMLYQSGFHRDVQKSIERFEKQKYESFEFNHKQD
jgi:hypothetical protein